MEGTRRRAENTNICPECDRGVLTKDILSGTWICNLCGTQSTPPAIVPSIQKRKVEIRRKRERIETATERSLAFVLSELERLCAEIELPPHLLDYSITIYRKAVEKNLARGRSTDLMVAFSIYSACRQKSVPKSLDEISEVCGISKKELGRTYRQLSRTLRLCNRPASPTIYAERYCKDLNLDEKVSQYAKDILERAIDKGATSGLGPSGMAAAAVYISANLYGEDLSQSEISRTAEISEVTLRSRYNALTNSLGLRKVK